MLLETNEPQNLKKKLFIKTENILVMILRVIYLRLPFLEWHRRDENLFIFPPIWVITMFLQTENFSLFYLLFYFSIDKALNASKLLVIIC